MKAPKAPRLDPRRTAEFRKELLERARSWIPTWDLSDEQHDFGKAILDIAARFSAEVTERLDGAGEKMRRGFLDWLAVGGQAARPSRVPVVFKLTDSARDAVLAEAPVRLQVDAGGVPVVFETEKDVRVIPGALASVVAVDADVDAFYLPAPGLSDLSPLEALPVEWELKTFAAAGAKTLQVTPDTGLVPGMMVEGGGWQYEIDTVNGEIITVTSPLAAELPGGTSLLRKVTVFSPFEAGTQNQQEHALYIGHMDLLNLEAPATVDVVGLASLGTSVKWEYWGKQGKEEESRWVSLTPADPQPSNDAVVLDKLAGAVDVKEINGISSRWLRAYMKKADAPTQVDKVELRINCRNDAIACPITGDAPESPAAEALANTTPLVLDKTFFPLGKEPRQFDAFYLGSKEAFSKKDASVQLCVELADPSFLSLSPLRQGPVANMIVAGIGRDRALHILGCHPTTGAVGPIFNRDPLQPPAPGVLGIPATGSVVPLDRDVKWRLPVWSAPTLVNPNAGFAVAVPAGDSVWVWVELPTTASSGWWSLGQLEPDTQTPSRPIAGLIFLDGAQKMIALRAGIIYSRDWPAGTAWSPLVTLSAGNPVRWTVIAPIFTSDGPSGGLTTNNEFMGISDAGELFSITAAGTCTPRLPAKTFLPIGPVAFADAGGLTFVAVEDDVTPKLTAGNAAGDTSVDLPANSALIGGLDLGFDNTQVMVLGCLQTVDRSQSIVTWTPFDPVRPAELFATTFAANDGMPAGTPTRVLGFVLVPTTAAAVLAASFDLSKRQTLSTVLRTAVVTRDEDDQIVVNDYVAIETAAVWPTHRLEKITAPGIQRFAKTLLEFAFEYIDPALLVYRSGTTALTAQVPDITDLTKVTLANTQFGQDELLLITTDLPDPELYKIDTFDPMTREAVLNRALHYGTPPAAATTVQYRGPEATQAILRPLMRLSGPAANWEAATLTRTQLMFPQADPLRQTGEAFQVDTSGHPQLVVLADDWITVPLATASGAQFIVDGSLGEFIAQLGDTSTNPELSWEYSNGRGWWGLVVETDSTRHLKTTGVVRFKIPTDIAESDWAGKTNFWIRARLVGGDYGKEKVTVTTKDLGNNKTEQTVDRSTAGIRAPSVVKLHISYQVCAPVLPTFVLAQDSGSYRNQSDANRTPGAQVEAFVPIGVMLGRLAGTGAAVAAAAAKECPPPCQCQAATPTPAVAPAASTAGASSVLSAPAATGRAVFIGLTKSPSEAPVNVLLLVGRERDYSAVAPMTIDALVADRFVPIVADDTTRALGESGVLSMAFAVPPTPREMFGKTLSWLQLRPAATPPGASTASLSWSPTLRGAYLNAVWASATETLTRELLGSSDGAPRMTFTLARPPLLKDSLELRVREPLGDEERLELQARDGSLVLNTLQDLPGDWVLWTRVIDPGDESPDARVYGLDEATGRVTFGDGLHGMIPPIGRDAVVAFSYQRTETGAGIDGVVPGNTIGPRTPFNLVSPVEGVEAVIAADQAAGGAPPESDDRVLRFGFATLRHRRRAVTASDLEDLTLQSSPDFAQARCLIRRGYARLVVVMRGTNPQPNASQVRELRRLLLDAAPVALAAPGALRIEGPGVRKLRIDLTLQIPRLDVAGDVGRDVKKGLVRLFDTATGGADGLGWMLGQRPTEGDIAYALMDVPNLESVAGVVLHESKGRRSDAPWPESFKPNELAVLADDPVRLQFVTAGVTA